MTTWWVASCFVHKEFCDIVAVACGPEVSEAKYSSVMKGNTFDKAPVWLQKHWGCELKLVHDDGDIDKLYRQGYTRMGVL